MQATTATFLAGGSGRSPLSKDSAYASLLRSSSSVTLMAGQNSRDVHRDRHGVRRADRLRGGGALRPRRPRRGRDRERHARALLRARTPRPRARRSRLQRRVRVRVPQRGARHPRRRRRAARCSSASARDLARGHPHRGAAVARLGGVRSADGLRRQRQRHDEPARGRRARVRPEATFIFTSTNKVYGDTPNRLPLVDVGERLELPGGPPLLRRDRHDDVDRRLDALAVRRLQGGRGPDGAGVRALLRHADGLLPRRLPDRPAARGRAAARLPRPT